MKDGGRCWPWPSRMRARKEREQSIGKDKEAGLREGKRVAACARQQ